MTRKVKLETSGEAITVRESDQGVWLGMGAELRQLTDADLRHLIGTLARTKAARNARRAALCVQASGER